MLRACTSQFAGQDVHIDSHASVRCAEEVPSLVELAAAQDAVICHSLVEPAMRMKLHRLALAQGVPCIDLLGPAMSVMADRLAQDPLGKPGLLYEMHREQFDRLDAVDFTMAHDDGNRLHDLEQADVVLVGLSRVSKSVTCFYLASRGMHAANVPLIMGQTPDENLLQMPAAKVFGLTMNASHLAAVRQTRLTRLTSRNIPDYADVRALNHEIRWAKGLMREYGWTPIDVSYKATEEVAAQILDALQKGRATLVG